jgi:hypothetical protein
MEDADCDYKHQDISLISLNDLHINKKLKHKITKASLVMIVDLRYNFEGEEEMFNNLNWRDYVNEIKKSKFYNNTIIKEKKKIINFVLNMINNFKDDLQCFVVFYDDLFINSHRYKENILEYLPSTNPYL